MVSETPSAQTAAAQPDEKKPSLDLRDFESNGSEKVDSTIANAVRDPILDEIDEKTARRIVRKIDWRLIPASGILYFCCALDRVNIGAAEISGMKEELHLGIGNRYSLIALVYFFTYVTFQAPAALVARFVRPQIFLPSLALAWTVLMVGASFTQKWTEMVGVRLLLGVCEAAMYPTVIYLLSTWYLRDEIGKRYGLWLAIARTASTIGPFFQYGFIQMDGVAGRRGWRWVFSMDGVITGVFAILAFFITVGFPDRNPFPLTGRFLSDRELEWVLARVDAARADAHPEPFTLRRWLSGGKDWKIWIYGIINMCAFTIGFGVLYFSPSIVHYGMGFSAGSSMLLLAAPDAVGTIWMLTCCWLSDRWHNRGGFLIVNSIVAASGLPIVGYAHGTGIRFFGLSLAYIAGIANIPIVLAYQADNIRGQWKRSFCSATLIIFQGIGGIIAGTVFREKDAPKYEPGLGACLGSQVLIVLLTSLLTLHFKKENAKVKSEGKVLEGLRGFTYSY